MHHVEKSNEKSLFEQQLLKTKLLNELQLNENARDINMQLNIVIELLKRDNSTLEGTIKDMGKKHETYLRKTEIRQADLENRVKKSETENAIFKNDLEQITKKSIVQDEELQQFKKNYMNSENKLKST